MNQITELASVWPLSDETSFEPIADRLRVGVRATTEAMFEGELAEFLGRLRYGRADGEAKGRVVTGVIGPLFAE